MHILTGKVLCGIQLVTSSGARVEVLLRGGLLPSGCWGFVSISRYVVQSMRWTSSSLNLLQPRVRTPLSWTCLAIVFLLDWMVFVDWKRGSFCQVLSCFSPSIDNLSLWEVCLFSGPLWNCDSWSASVSVSSFATDSTNRGRLLVRIIVRKRVS